MQVNWKTKIWICLEICTLTIKFTMIKVNIYIYMYVCNVMSGQNCFSFLQTLLPSHIFENCKWCVLPKSSRHNFYTGIESIATAGVANEIQDNN